jgi:hypothetical protein
LIEEVRRRAYLSAMQVATWLPRLSLPFAAPPRPEWLPAAASEQDAEVQVLPVQVLNRTPAPEPQQPRVRLEVPRPISTVPIAAAVEAAPIETTEPAAQVLPPPRFTLQLLRAGSCALLVELPTGEAFTRRDPAYLLLKDLLRAAGLPDAPLVIGEPVRWPLLVRGSMDQGPQAALEYVQSFVAAQLEQQEPCVCVWLVGLPAVRYAGEADESAYNRELQVDGLGTVWALPGLELLMDEPQRKAELWHSMRRLMPRWSTVVLESL